MFLLAKTFFSLSSLPRVHHNNTLKSAVQRPLLLTARGAVPCGEPAAQAEGDRRAAQLAFPLRLGLCCVAAVAEETVDKGGLGSSWEEPQSAKEKAPHT